MKEYIKRNKAVLCYWCGNTDWVGEFVRKSDFENGLDLRKDKDVFVCECCIEHSLEEGYDNE